MQLLFPLDEVQLQQIIENACKEDIGQGDVTSLNLMDKQVDASLHMVARENMVVAGLPLVEHVFNYVGGGHTVDVRFPEKMIDGKRVNKGEVICSLHGSACDILQGERVALNFVQHMSAIATYTSKFVDAVDGLPAKIYDTRKTTPGLRILEKYAVKAGGGENHRMRLDDMVMLKDNHIRIFSECLDGSINQAVEKIKSNISQDTIPIMVETDRLDQVEEALNCSVEYILLDNMDIDSLRKAVALRNTIAPTIRLEASGGVTLSKVREIAQTGVDRISVGALTHSAQHVDIGMDWL